MQPRLLLVHSPLVRCETWEPIARDLAADGYAVTVPDLAGTIGAGPPYYQRQAEVIAGCEKAGLTFASWLCDLTSSTIMRWRPRIVRAGFRWHA
jgi:hypothetical protein